jgi:undecaprenyl-diphosphatase
MKHDPADLAPTLEAPPAIARRAWLPWLIWAVLLSAAFTVDWPVANWVYVHRPSIPRHSIEYQNGPLSREDSWVKIIKWPGDFRFTLAVAALVLILHRDRWKAAGFICLAGIFSGVNSLFKWVFGRTRPLRPGESPGWNFFNDGPMGLFNHQDVSFPSGHAALAFATAAALSVLWPRWTLLFYALAAVVGLERILENAHFTSDVIAAAFVGWLCVKVIVLVADAIEKHHVRAGNDAR